VLGASNLIDSFMPPPRSLAELTAVLPTYSCAKQDGNHTSLEEVQVRVLCKGRGCTIWPRRKFGIINAGAMSDTHEVTLLLNEWAKGDQKALDQLTPLVYKELRQLAAAYLRRERLGHTLQPTALVHESYLRLVDQSSPNFENRSHFYGVAARLMRQILVDHARRKQAGKRGGLKVPLEQAVSFREDRVEDLVALDAGLTALEKIDPRKCKAVELRYFGGLSVEELAKTLEVSAETVRRDLRMAEAWLNSQI
jgi:RNA polymerase sigma-70 factor, ECF subfamily